MKVLSKSVVINGKRLTSLKALILVAFIISILSIFFVSSISSAKDETVTYTYASIRINEGETLNSIASSHLSGLKMTHTELVNEITRLNHMPTDVLYAGSYIIIPVALHQVNI